MTATPMLELITAARLSGDWSPVVAAIPYARFLDLSVQHTDGAFVCRLPFAPHIVGNPALPAIHGGAIGALLESAAVLLLLEHADTAMLPKIITLTVDYLLSGRPVETFASGTITRLGRRVATVHTRAWQTSPDRPIATANAHFLLAPEDR
ncbi:MAG: PaaI family thioesterase [Deltaproteobacteria bacterium]